MSSTIDYIYRNIPCPHCKEIIEISMTREQDNRICEVYTSISENIFCDICNKRIPKKYIKEYIREE